MTSLNTNKEILEKAIAKAIEGGWRPSKEMELIIWPYGREDGFESEEQFGIWYNIIGLKDVTFDHDFAKALWGEQVNPRYQAHYVPARGYPGESPTLEERKKHIQPLNDMYLGLPEYMWSCVNCKKTWKSCLIENCKKLEHSNTGWQYHLQRMVISPDPIKYLGEHLEESK